PAFSDELELLAMVRDPSRRAEVVERAAERWWKRLDRRASVGPDWMKPNYDDSDWETMTLPATWDGDLESFDGLVYFRKAIEVPGHWLAVGGQLRLGAIDDMDDAWINGHHLGGEHAGGRWNVERRYDVKPRYLRPGLNVIAVRVLDTGGKGGINGLPNKMMFITVDQRDLIRLKGPWRYKKGPSVDQLPPRPQGADIGRNTASVLFNGMIAPIAPFAIRGVIWYQGESNRRDAEQYRRLFPALIENWRGQWGQDLLPFYYVQIAPFDYGGDTGQTARLREAQLMALQTPDTGMVVTMDIGNPRDIHPRNKQEVGRRLALWARARTYGEDGLVHSGPLYRSMTREGDAVRVHFTHVGGGLELRSSSERHFLVAGADRRFVPAAARVDGDAIVVSSPEVPDPVAVRYGWSAAGEPNLFNVEGLPASPFRTDDW
ncbi:MAG: sialate O-acetylesterase, partial [Planctomycetota bacterium]